MSTSTRESDIDGVRGPDMAPHSPRRSDAPPGGRGAPRSPMGRAVLRFRRNGVAWTALALLVVLPALVVLAPWIAPYGPETVQLGNRLQSPSREHWLGTDEYGRDVLTRLLHGGQVSLAVGIAS